MPGYYDWKIRNCPEGAIAKAGSFLKTLDEVEPYLLQMWESGKGSFSDEVNAKLKNIVEMIDAAEDNLEAAKHRLAEFFPGGPIQKGAR